MATKQQIIEIFSSGCPLRHAAIALVRREVGSSAEIIIHNMMEPRGFGRATALGVRSVSINGKLASCCSRSGVDI
jgi:hypothetical protein